MEFVISPKLEKYRLPLVAIQRNRGIKTVHQQTRWLYQVTRVRIFTIILIHDYPDTVYSPQSIYHQCSLSRFAIKLYIVPSLFQGSHTDYKTWAGSLTESIPYMD